MRPGEKGVGSGDCRGQAELLHGGGFLTITMDTQAWAEEQFGKCDLGDKRRTRRLVHVANSVLCHPSGSLPEQMANWGDLKAAYRLFDSEDVTFEGIATPHWEQTRQREPGTYLVLSDTTELDFGIERDIEGLSQTGNGGGSGFLLHSALVAAAKGEEVFGLAGQKIRYRKRKPKKENTSQRLNRDRESLLWGQVIDQVGKPPQDVRWVHVMDRGADNFEVYCHCLEQNSDWVVRVTQSKRKILTPAGETKPLEEYAKSLPLAGTYELDLRARGRSREHGPQPARTAKVEVRFGRLEVPVPNHKSPYVKELSPSPLTMWVVYAVEVDAPKGVEPIQWILLTSLPVESFEDAWLVLTYYEKRWLIEEWHKALKSGCRVERRQLKTKERLERITALLSVVSVRLLQLKSAARTNPERPATEVVPKRWISMLQKARKKNDGRKANPKDTMTIGTFYRELAKLGGFLGRKCDNEPGWITIWRGWQKLYLLVRGADLAQEAN